jgi:hypothetical protein
MIGNGTGTEALDMVASTTEKSVDRESAKAVFVAIRALSRIQHPSRAVQDAMRALHRELSLHGYSILLDSGTGRRTLAGPDIRAQRRA